MIILWVSLGFVFLVSLAARYFSVQTSVGPVYVHPNKILASAAAITLILVSGLRNNIGDTYFYKHSYSKIIGDFDWDKITSQGDIGFTIFQILLKRISDDPQILLITTALITNACIVIVLYKYARLFEISIFVYITSGAFIVSMNGIRQYLTAAIIFAASRALFDGRWKLYMTVVLLASFLHQSALIMIPVYFLVRRRAWQGSTFAMLSIAVLIVLSYGYFSDLFFKAIEDTQYGYYKDFEEGGANPLRILVCLVPVIIAYFGRVKFNKIFKYSDIVVNLSIIGVVLMIIASQNWIFARLAIYFNLYQILLIGWIIKLFKEKQQGFVYLMLVILYFIYFFYENVIVLGINYVSYYLVWPF